VPRSPSARQPPSGRPRKLPNAVLGQTGGSCLPSVVLLTKEGEPHHAAAAANARILRAGWRFGLRRHVAAFPSPSITPIAPRNLHAHHHKVGGSAPPSVVLLTKEGPARAQTAANKSPLLMSAAHPDTRASCTFCFNTANECPRRESSLLT
jgi:hypothetical protein